MQLPDGEIIKVAEGPYTIPTEHGPRTRTGLVVTVRFPSRTHIHIPLERFPDPERVQERMVFRWLDRYGGDFEILPPPAKQRPVRDCRSETTQALF